MYITEREKQIAKRNLRAEEEALASEKYEQIRANSSKVRVSNETYKKYVGEDAAQLYYAKINLEEPRIKAWYCFYSKETVKIALDAFFQNEYFLRRIAKKCALLDEGDIIAEEIDCGSFIGKVYDTEGRGHNTSMAQIKLEVLPWSEKGLPFKVVKIRPIMEEELW